MPKYYAIICSINIIDRVIVEFPDYVGNDFFNTLGNIYRDDGVGIQIVDFESGRLLNIQGRAELIATDQKADPTNRILRVHIEEVHRKDALALIRRCYQPEVCLS